MQTRVVQAQYEQGAAGGYNKTEGASRWWQRGAGGGAGGVGRMDRTSSSGHRVEETDQGTVEGKGTSSGETGVEWDEEQDKDKVDRDKVYDRG